MIKIIFHVLIEQFGTLINFSNFIGTKNSIKFFNFLNTFGIFLPINLKFKKDIILNFEIY